MKHISLFVIVILFLCLPAIVQALVPTITTCAADQSAEAGAGCQAAVPDFTAGVVVADNSGSVTIAQSPLAGSPASYGTNTVTLTATDGSGNFAQCTAQFIVIDTLAPAITQCAAEITVSTDAGTNIATNVILGAVPFASDVCGLAGTSNNAPETFGFGTNVVTWSVTDTHGNTATCPQKVIVLDTESPLLACPVDIVTNLAAGECSLTNLHLGTPVAADNVGLASVTNDAPAVFAVGTNQVVWLATDLSGNTTVCTQLVAVLDVTAPQIAQLPADQQASAGANCQAAVPDYTGGVIASDDCTGSGSLTITQAPAVGTQVGPGTNVVMLTVTDASGNATAGTVNFAVTDDTPPTITCSLVNVQCAGDGPPVGTNASVVVRDNCGPVTLTWLGDVTNSLGCVNHFIITRTYTAADGAGNSSTNTQTITVHDTTTPTAVCANITVDLNADGYAFITAADVNGGSYDNCFGPLTLAIDQTFFGGYRIFGCGDIGPNSVLLTVNDQCGNVGSCTAIVTVRDVTAPTISCPANVTTFADAGKCSASGVALGTATASDNCGAYVANNAPSCYPVGTNFVVWTAMDASGNSAACTQQVVVVDSQPPLITCSDVTVFITNGMTIVCDPSLGSPLVSDNCGVASVTNDAPICFSAGTTLFVWTATDIHGNSASCTQQVFAVPLDFDPSILRMVGIEAIGDDIKLTWQTPGNTTNLIQLATPIINGNYTNNYINLDTVVVPGSRVVITNWVDYGGATNYPARYYRIGLQLDLPTQGLLIASNFDGYIRRGGEAAIFSVYDHDTPRYVYNTSCWGYGLDLTPVAVWNSELFTSNSSRAGATLISPRHVLMAHHFLVGDGERVRFVAQDGMIVERTVVAHKDTKDYPTAADCDLSVGLLDSDVPNSISFCKVLPKNWESYFGAAPWSCKGVPVAFVNQWRELVAQELWRADSRTSNGGGDRYLTLTEPCSDMAVLRAPFCKPVVSGDSGQPVLMFVGRQPVVCTALFTDYGYFGVQGYETELNLAMALLGGGYQLTPVELP